MRSDQYWKDKILMKLHVFVATTQGLVAIQNITPIDDEDISSIVSINGTSTTANISSAYHSFVKKGAGIIQQDFGVCSYRINTSQRIDNGNSWQLGFYLAHVVHQQGLLGNGEVKPGDQVICATGEVNTTSREVHRVADVNLKQRLATEQIQQWQKLNVKTSFLVPEQNATDIDKELSINTELISDLAHALSFLSLHASIKTKKQVKQQQASQKSNSQQIDLACEKWIRKLKPKSVLMSLLVIVFFIFLINIIPLSPHTSPIERTNNTKLAAQQTWQVLLLTKSQYEINEQLQSAYTMIEKTISEQLIAENFEITDKALLMGTNNFTEQALIKLNKNDINVAIRFNLDVNKLNDPSRDTWRYELSANFVDIASRKQIETHNEYGEFSNDEINCNQHCMSKWFADNARKLAQDMGAILVVKLKHLPRRYQFELDFQHFLTDELLLIDEHLTALNGFISAHLLDDTVAENASLHQVSSRKYGYVSYIPLNELELELYKSFDRLGIEVNKASGNFQTLAFIRKHSPYYFYYFFIGALVFFLFISIYLTKLKRKHTIELARLASGRHAEGWLAYYDDISSNPFFRRQEWQAQQSVFINDVQLSKILSDEGLQYAELEEYDKTHSAIENALKLNVDNADAKNLKAKTASFIKGHEQLLSGKSMIVSQPEQAINLLLEAKNLNSHLKGSVNEPLMEASIRLVLKAFKHKNYYQAYSLIDKYIHQPSSISIDGSKRQKLIEIRNNIEQYIQPMKGGVVGQQALANCFFYTASTLELGRNVNDPAQSFSIGYKNISRAGNQCRFSRKSNEFYLEDQGSTNGSFLNNTKLVTPKKINANKYSLLTLGGRSNADNMGICQLELNVLSKKSPTLIMQLKKGMVQFVDRNEYKVAWASMDTDLTSRWILMGEEVSLSSNNGHIELGNDQAQQEVIAYLVYQNGFYIRPKQLIKNNDLLLINGQVVYEKMPINEGAIISLNGLNFSLTSLAN